MNRRSAVRRGPGAQVTPAVSVSVSSAVRLTVLRLWPVCPGELRPPRCVVREGALA
ncbi:MAG: hypothetical protein LC795_08655 [Acidobacteria bacterium]|nr:hypothetical protein [Acidobacteriota bacterium]